MLPWWRVAGLQGGGVVYVCMQRAQLGAVGTGCGVLLEVKDGVHMVRTVYRHACSQDPAAVLPG